MSVCFANGTELILSTTSDPKTFNDIVASETSSSLVTGMLFEGLTKEDPFTLKVIPNLAQSWEVSPDGLRWIFYLRRDVRWFDGIPLTADDVVFTFHDLIYNPQIPSQSRDIFTIDGKEFKVSKIDDYTVTFTLPKRFAPFLHSMSQSILPQHCLAQSVRQGKFAFTWGIDTAPRYIIGTGPFYLDQYLPGERLVFKRNPHYWKRTAQGKPLPYLDKIIFLIIPDTNAALLKFIDGELDSIGVSGQDYPLLKPLEVKKNFTIYQRGADFGSSFIIFNENSGVNPQTHKPYLDPVKRSWFENVNFRRAVAHAIDKKKIIQILFNELGYPQGGPMSPSSGFFYNPNVPVYNYDLTKAKKLLKEAGFVYRNGLLYDAHGHRVEFNLYTNGVEHDARVQMAYMIRSDLEKLGMKVNFLPVEFNTLVSKLTASYNWDAVILGLTGGVEPHFGKNVWTSSGQLHMWNPKQKQPATAWERRLDEIYDQGGQELDENKRKFLYDEFQVIAATQVPMIYTVLAANIYAVRNRFGNLKPSAYAGVWHNIEEIYVLDPKSHR